MNKKTLLLTMLCMVLSLSSCSKYNDDELWDNVNDLANRVQLLEESCKQMNTNIEAIQVIVNALNTQDYITSITPIKKDGKEIGYTITFAKSTPITIYNGTDGNTPQIGIKKDTDNIFYWTLDGEWLTDENGNKIKAQGENGKDGADGEDGKDGTDGADGEDGKDGTDGVNGTNGTNGTNGEDGKDGITPQLKIENDYWHVSYDKGETWTELGKAKGEDGVNGADGTNGENGKDAIFSSIDYTTDTDYVIFTLSNGTEIKIPTWSAFEDLKTLCTQINNNLSSLQAIVTALQNGNYITDVTPKEENGEVIGYIISFAKGSPIIIYHGKNGADGTDGTNAAAPVIGIKQDADGKYYWTLDGEFILVDGNKIQANGEDGTNGTNGVDGITPQLKIENDYWYVSYDNGKNWEKLDKATGEDGTNGADGKDGESVFSKIDYTTDSDYVVFTLADGTTEIKLPTWSAFEELKALCTQMNSNLSSLQTIVTALQNNNYITDVTPKEENGVVVGYIISFSKGDPIVIYHGKNGTNGTTPVIGIKQDIDNKFYWTLNGEFILIDGNKIQANGEDGEDGTNGADGITPQLKIENDYWYISYDNGKNWEKLDKATGEDGENGKDGETLFSKVEYTPNADYVIFTLSDGTEVKVPTWAAFEALQTLCNQMNTNLSSLQSMVTALENRDYITGVTTVNEDGETIGYIISFAKSNPITIYNGTDGKNATAPVIGIKQDNDGKYYWTLDGEYILVNGLKIQANGENGSNGTDGVTPKLKIEENYWHVSYDDGKTWSKLEKATGENGKDGDSIFKDVTQDEDNVYFELTDGTIITISKNGNNNTTEEGITTVTLTEAGTLAEVLGDQKLTLTSLKIIGEINGTDVKCLKQMCNSYIIYGSENDFSGVLTELDLSEATIVEGGDIYYNASDASWPQSTSENTIGPRMFTNSSLSKIILPNNTTTIGESAFFDSPNLTEVSIPSSVTMIDIYAFYACKLKTVIADGVITIQDNAFRGNTNLTEVIIGSNITTIGNYAFAICENLSTFTCLATTAPTLEGDPFYDTPDLYRTIPTLKIPKGSSYSYSSWKTHFTNIEELSE